MQFSVLVLFLRKNCFSVALLVSTEQRIWIPLKYTKKKETKIKIRPELKIAIFLLQFCKFNLYEILNFSEIIYIHIFAFLNFWFWEKKRFADFFLAIGVAKKIKTSKKHHTEELHKKGTILHPAPLITPYFTHPVLSSCRLRQTWLGWHFACR